MLRVVARLADGVSHEQAQAAARPGARLQATHPDSNEKTGFNVERLHDRVTGQIKPGLVALAGAVGFVLLIACANIANLLTRRADRHAAVNWRCASRSARDALASVSQLLTESLLLAVFGGVEA